MERLRIRIGRWAKAKDGGGWPCLVTGPAVGRAGTSCSAAPHRYSLQNITLGRRVRYLGTKYFCRDVPYLGRYFLAIYLN